jgi:hypothetical protein
LGILSKRVPTFGKWFYIILEAAIQIFYVMELELLVDPVQCIHTDRRGKTSR